MDATEAEKQLRPKFTGMFDGLPLTIDPVIGAIVLSLPSPAIAGDRAFKKKGST